MLILTDTELRLISLTAETTKPVSPENDRIGPTTEKCFMVCLVRFTALHWAQPRYLNTNNKGVTNSKVTSFVSVSVIEHFTIHSS